MEEREENRKEHAASDEKNIGKNATADIYAIIQDVLKNLWIAVIVGISAAFLAYVGAYILYQPEYVSSTTFVVSAKGSNTGAYANLSQTQRLGETFRTVLDSDVLKRKVAEELGMDSFDGTVSVSIVPETNLLTMSVTAGSPTTAFQLLNTMLEQYPSISQNVLGEVVLEVFEEPNYPSAPRTAFQGNAMMKRGFAAGAGIMIVLFALLSYLRDSVKNEKEVEIKLDTTLFTTVYHEKKYKNIREMLKRNQKKLWFTEPSVSFGFGETMKKIRTKLLYQQRKNGGKVLVITSAGQGEGKTMLSVNLALALSQYSKKVLLIEGNLRNAYLREYLGLESAEVKSWGACAAAKENLNAAICSSSDLGFSVMVNDGKVAHSAELISSSQLTHFLDKMKQEMDFIIVDAPHIKGRADAEAWLRRADMSLLVVRQNRILAKYINDSIDIIEGYDCRLLGCVFNDVPGRSGILTSGYGYGYGYSYGYGYGYGYGRYGKYGKYGKYGSYHTHHRKEESEKE